MLKYAVLLLVATILSGVLGFALAAGTVAMIAKVCFVAFLALFVFSLLHDFPRY